MPAITWPSLRARRRSSLALAALCIGAVAGCASVPHIDRQSASAPGAVKPQIIGTRGPLNSRQITALLDRIATEPGEDRLLQRHFAVEQQIAESPLIAGNRTRVLRDGPASFAAMFAAIKSAKHHINLEYYIFEDIEQDGLWLGDLLIAERQAGIAVNIIYDSFGSGATPTSFLDRLKQAGVNIVSYNPVNPLEARAGYSPNDRDHRKILIIDGSTAVVGGVNLSVAYQRNSLAKSGAPDDALGDPWRDTDLQIDGPAVAELQKLFIEHWTDQKGPPLDETGMFPVVPPDGGAVVHVLGSTPDDAIPQYYITLLSAIRVAEKSIMVSAAYFVPTAQEMDDLIAASRRGVDVRLMLPSKSDSSMAIAMGHVRYTELLEAGVKIFEIQDVVLHSKTVVIDGVWSVIGSSNFDHRSVIFNDEVDVVVLGSDNAQDLETIFREDEHLSKTISLQDWRSRPLWDRAVELYARLWESWL